MVAAARESLARTGLQQLSIGQLHWSTSNYAPWQEGALVGGLADAAQAGLVAEVGVSNYGAKQMARVATVLERQGVRLASAQVRARHLRWLLAQAGPAGVHTALLCVQPRMFDCCCRCSTAC